MHSLRVPAARYDAASDLGGAARNQSETVSVPVERDSELVVRYGGAVVRYPIRAGKRTVIDVAINIFGVVTLSEEGADPSEARKSGNPTLIVFFVCIGVLLLLAFIKAMIS